MTLLAGVFPRSRDASVPRELTDSIVGNLSRNPAHTANRIERNGAVLVKVNIGAYAEPGEYTDRQGAVSIVCGEPLVLEAASGVTGAGRDSDLEFLHGHFLRGDTGILTQCEGNFSFAHLSADASELIIGTDHMGIRPLYYMVTPDLVIFSSVFRLFAQLPGVRRTVNANGILEWGTLSYCFGEKTPIVEIARIMPAQVLRFTSSCEMKSERYFSWERDIAVYPAAAAVQHERIHESFQRAVRRRLRSDDSAIAFLSGGMDSRVVVSALREAGMRVHTYNFSIPGEQDELYARAFAAAAGTEYRATPRREPMALREGSWTFLLSESLAGPQGAPAAKRPRVVWSGDGGSTCVGALYITDKVDGHLREGDLLRAAQSNSPSVPVGVIPGAQLSNLPDLIEATHQALRQVSTDDPVRSYHLFLMFNGQRRILDKHFEQADLHGLEFQLPFFDAGFLKEVLRVPIQYLRKHSFYHDWIKYFPDFATSVPWQTYPGHLPCPVSSSSFPKAAAQWDGYEGEEQSAIKRNGHLLRMKRVREMLTAGDFPSAMISRPKLLAAALVSKLKPGKYDYVLDFSYEVFRFARNATEKPSWSRGTARSNG